MAETTALREQLQRRLTALRAEFQEGQRMLADLETRQAALRDTLLRLVGAITVLEEELDVAARDGGPRPAGEAADARRAG
jgi:predicted nuclease with TOPRIM domain